MKIIRTAVAAAALALALPALAFELPSQWQVRQIDLPTNDMVYDRVSGDLFVSVSSLGGIGRGNTITRIDPGTGNIRSSVFIGSEPGPLGLAADGSRLWVGLNGAGTVRSFDTATGTGGVTFSLGSDNFLGPYFAEDIAVQPGNSGVIAVSRRNQGFSPRHEGVAIFDNGVQRPLTTPDHTGSNRIEFSQNPGILYGYNNETTEFGFRTMNVGTNGVSITNNTGNLISGFGTDIKFDAGLIYAGTGRVVDATGRFLAGTYAASGIVEPDSGSGLTFFMNSFSQQLSIFDQDTFVRLASYVLPQVSGQVSSLERWGDNGLAMRTSSQIFLLAPVPEPEVHAMLLAGLFLVGSIARRRRLRAAA